MLALIFGTPVALALVCDPGDVACADANALRDRINAQQPGAIADDHPRSRLRTDKILVKLRSIYAAADAGGCTMDGLSAFVYTSGDALGDWNRASDTGTVAGEYRRNVMSGSYAGDASGSIGDFGIYTAGKLAGEWGADDGYIGGFIRTSGLGGVGFAAIGSCPLPIQDVFEPYLPDLARIPDPEPPVATESGAGFLRVQVLDAAAGGASASASYSIAFALGGASTPAESSTNLLNPSIPVP